MYATATGSAASMFSPRQLSNIYRQIDVETGVSGASSHQLITMLFNGALESCMQAHGAMLSGNIETKCAAIRKCVGIIDEGLKASLNLKDGGEIAQGLHELYTYITIRLTHANLRNDPAALEECTKLLTPIRDAWVAIAPKDAAVVRAAMEVRA